MNMPFLRRAALAVAFCLCFFILRNPAPAAAGPDASGASSDQAESMEEELNLLDRMIEERKSGALATAGRKAEPAPEESSAPVSQKTEEPSYDKTPADAQDTAEETDGIGSGAPAVSLSPPPQPEPPESVDAAEPSGKKFAALGPPPDGESLETPAGGGAATAEPDSAPQDDLEREIDDLDKKIEERIRVSGKYRMAMGGGRHRTFSLNDANSDLQDRDFHYLFGERLNNTFDPDIWSQFQTNIDADVTDQLSVYTQLTADPWSYVGRSEEVRVPEAGGQDGVRIQYKYWGPNNSTIGEIYRADFRNQLSTPVVEVKNGQTVPVTLRGITDQGLTYHVPALDIDYEFRPVRKLWADYKGDIWHVRGFLLADQEQAMTTDDPLGLSNTKDFWQPSPWTARWVPYHRFADNGTTNINGSIQRGHYSDVEAFNAKTSYGEHLTQLRGVAAEADFGRTYMGGMIASPFSPWDDYDEPNNLPGVARVKHQVTPQWMVGGLYGFRVGMIDREPDAYNQVLSADTRYYLTPQVSLYGQMAGSRDEIDRLSQGNRHSPEGFESSVDGLAYRAGVDAEFEHRDGKSDFNADVAWMDEDFRPQLSTYRAMRDDNYWGKHLTFLEYQPGLEYFRIGRGIDVNRYVGRVSLRTTMLRERLGSVFDVRHVRSADKSSFIENVVREELTYKLTPRIKAKGFTRWMILPNTNSDVEPYLGDFFDLDSYNIPPPTIENLAIDQGLDPSRLTWGAGLQYVVNSEWTAEASYQRSNDIPDFPRGLQNDIFLRATERDPETPNIVLDRTQTFLYGQHVYDLPPYDYFSIVKEKVIFEPDDTMTLTFHAAQNSYKMWAPIDEQFNHQGISIDYRFNKRVSLFSDYTHSVIADIPRLIDTGYTELNYRDHHNVYVVVKWQIDPSKKLLVEYGEFGASAARPRTTAPVNPFSVSEFALSTIDTEQIFRVSLEGDF